MEAFLVALRIQFAGALHTLTLQYKDGELTKEEWTNQFIETLSRYLLLAMMYGVGADTLTPLQDQVVTAELEDQMQYLNGFIKEIDSLDSDQAASRAELYASSATPVFSKGVAWGLLLPAYPGEGSECGQFCHCHWRVDWLSHEEGNADAYWEIGESEHCPTCLDRAAQWNPLRIRNGQY